MTAAHHDAAFLTAFGKQWIATWNSHDLDRILALYADDSEMTSDVIPRLGLHPSGTIFGKAMLRKYWGIALERVPELHFDLIEVFVSPDSLVVFYTNQRGHKICEYLRLNADGKIRQGSANHLLH
jgi:ketosteroid isomerase-like protein